MRVGFRRCLGGTKGESGMRGLYPVKEIKLVFWGGFGDVRCRNTTVGATLR